MITEAFSNKSGGTSVDIEERTEAQLAADMHAVVDRMVVPIDLVEGGERRGRRARRFRAAGAGAGVVVVVAAVAVGVGALTSVAPRTPHSTLAQPAASSASRSTASQTKVTGPLTAAKVKKILPGLLPPGSFTWTADGAQPDVVLVTGTYSDSKGPYSFTFSTVPANDDSVSMDPLSCATFDAPDQGKRPAGAPPKSCTIRNLADGRKARVSVNPAFAKTDTHAEGFYTFQVVLNRPDGLQIDFSIGNGRYGSSGGSLTSATPPITLDQVVAIVDSTQWP